MRPAPLRSALRRARAQTTFDNRIYALSLSCGERYPQVPPTLRFNSKINLPYIDSSGIVSRSPRPQGRPAAPSGAATHAPHGHPRPLRARAQANGQKCPGLCDWKESDTLDTVLLKIRRDLCSPSNRKLPQPAEGATYQ